MRASILVVGLGLGTVAGCIRANAFHCAADHECVFEGVPGTCEATGFCSFPDEDCESGWSYGEHAGAGLEGECVPVEGGSGGSTGDDDGQDDGGTSSDDGSADDGGSSGSDDGGTSDTETGTGTGTGTSDDGGTSGTETTSTDDCGNGTIDPGEDCDGDDLGGATCASEGAGNHGEVACTGACELDTSGCTTCGNGLKEGSEACDGADFGGATCASEGAGQFGSLSCTEGCQIDTSGCTDCNAEQTWDFSSCNQGWSTEKAYASATGSVSWDCGEPTSGPGTTGGHDGQWATDLSGNYNAYESSALESPLIDLSQCNATSVRLVWEHWWDFEGSSSNYDGGVLEVSTNGGFTWTYVTPDVNGYYMGSPINADYPPVDGEYGYSSATGATEQVWTTSELDLTPYVGENDVMVRFVIGSDAIQSDPGWYIDWVEVRAQ